MTTDNERRRLTEPLESMTTFFGTLMIIGSLAVLGLVVFGTNTYRIYSGTVCVNQPGTTYNGGPAWNVPDVTAKPGNSVLMEGTLQACANNTTPGQQALYIATELPSILFACASSATNFSSRVSFVSALPVNSAASTASFSGPCRQS